MSDAQMHELGQISGPAFDLQLLRTMIARDEGTLKAARTEVASGQNHDAKALARHVIEARQSEIAVMQTNLKGFDFGYF